MNAPNLGNFPPQNTHNYHQKGKSINSQSTDVAFYRCCVLQMLCAHESSKGPSNSTHKCVQWKNISWVHLYSKLTIKYSRRGLTLDWMMIHTSHPLPSHIPRHQVLTYSQCFLMSQLFIVSVAYLWLLLPNNTHVFLCILTYKSWRKVVHW